MTHWTVLTSASKSFSIAGNATLRAVKSLAITKIAQAMATSAMTVPRSIRSVACAGPVTAAASIPARR